MTLPSARWVDDLKPSPLHVALHGDSAPIASFALGLPDSRSFPTAAIRAAASESISPESLQYHPPSRELRAVAAALSERRGFACAPEQILLTSGAQQGLALALQVLLDPDGLVITDRFVYPNFKALAQQHYARFAAIDGLFASSPLRQPPFRPSTTAVGATLMYVVPAGHNPLGTTLDHRRATELIEYAAAASAIIIEDDPYGLIQLGSAPGVCLRSISSDVVYVGSFSKILGPALRLGWVVVPTGLMPAFELAKESADINLESQSHAIVRLLLERLDLDAHLAALVDTYRIRRDAMEEALQHYVGGRAHWCRPTDGFFFWVTVPGVQERRLVVEARELGVDVMPGGAFDLAGPVADGHVPDAHVRLAYSATEPDIIDLGVRLLASALERCRD